MENITSTSHPERRTPQDMPALEIWGGIECTVNRVGDRFFDQLERSGHKTRLADLDLFAELGLHTLRYPILWEHVAPDSITQPHWAWADERLGRLQELEIRPIVGLLHHGSGPCYTGLIDPAFPEKLAEYAAAIARRYSWLNDYTPVNEPLTTARFSGLYGHWYPHGRDAATFIRTLLNQCRGVALAMQAIRQVNPTARLIQTEDLGKTYGTPTLAYQVEFENNRRWLSLDLLCGRLDRAHPLWGHLLWAGATEPELEWFLEHPCPPDIIGVNYYLTSERFLDEHLELYPPQFHGSNGRHHYADVEAVRVRAEGLAGPRRLIEEVWQRYHLPIAVTEVHNGSTREEQLRWFVEVWDAARRLRHQGADIRAVTAWALLGTYDWNSLLTSLDDHYEPGVFDVRSNQPRPTALAHLVRTLAADQKPAHPVLTTPGWWRRPQRLLYKAVGNKVGNKLTSRLSHTEGQNLESSQRHHKKFHKRQGDSRRPLLIIGATGTLGSGFTRLCAMRGLLHLPRTRQDLNIRDKQAIVGTLKQFKPWAVINAAGYVRVDDAEADPDCCYAVNCDAPTMLAEACAEQGIQFLTFSSDLVFDGRQTTPYVESDPVAPLNVYGRSKAAAEQSVLEANPDALVVRTSAFFGPWDAHNFITKALQTVADNQRFVAANDTTVSPTYIPDLIQTCLDLLIDLESGLWHLANQGAITWAELAQTVVSLAGYDPNCIEGRPTNTLRLAAARPLYSVLGSERALLLPSLDDALGRYLVDRSQ